MSRPALHAAREADDSFILDFRELRSGLHLARATLYGARCIAALWDADLFLDGARDRVDMSAELDVIADLRRHLAGKQMAKGAGK